MLLLGMAKRLGLAGSLASPLKKMGRDRECNSPTYISLACQRDRPVCSPLLFKEKHVQHM